MRNHFFFSLLLLMAATPALSARRNAPPPNLQPYLANLYVTFNDGETRKFCASGIIDERVILVAAHCMLLAKGFLHTFPDAKVYLQPEGSRKRITFSGWQKHPTKDMALAVLDDIVPNGAPIVIANDTEIATVTRDPQKYEFVMYKRRPVFLNIDSFEISTDSYTHKVNEFAEPKLKEIDFSKFLAFENLRNGEPLVQHGDSGLPLFVFVNGQWKAFAIVTGGALRTAVDALKFKFFSVQSKGYLYGRIETIDLDFYP